MRSIITFIFVFGVIVIVHEFGHFIFAKRSGILVREFAIGMGPKIFSHRKNGTTYTLRILPLGGYVRMAGQGEEEVDLAPGMPIAIEVNEENKVVKINTSKKVQLANSIPIEVTSFDLEDKLEITGNLNGDEDKEVTYLVDHDATIIEEDGIEVQIAPRDVQFQSAKLYQRMLTNFAGPMNNFILALVLFILLAFLQGIPNDNSNVLGDIIADSPADQAGLEPGDKVLSIDGKKISTFSDFTDSVKNNADTPLQFVVERDGEQKKLTVTPEFNKEKQQGAIGVYSTRIYEEGSFLQRIASGFKQTYTSVIRMIKTLGDLITNFSINKLGGPVMIYKLSSEAAKSGFVTVISLMAFLSMNLGIVNLIPIPALDGGKLVLNIFEGVRGKPLSQEKEGLLTLVGFGFLMILMVLVTWKDIQSFFF